MPTEWPIRNDDPECHYGYDPGAASGDYQVTIEHVVDGPCVFEHCRAIVEHCVALRQVLPADSHGKLERMRRLARGIADTYCPTVMTDPQTMVRSI